MKKTIKAAKRNEERKLFRDKEITELHDDVDALTRTPMLTRCVEFIT